MHAQPYMDPYMGDNKVTTDNHSYRTTQLTLA
jgi:hypothetical protein